MSGGLLVVAGAGDLGSRLVALRLARGEDVIGIRRRDAAAVPGLRPLRADLASGRGLAQLPRRAEAIVFCAAPDQRDEAAYRALYVDGLRRLLDACEAPRLLFVSSTAVYGEDAGEWVDEGTPARPQKFNGAVLLQGERTLTAQPGGVVLRLSGLYGPGRDALRRRARGDDPGLPRWSNRIHVDDAAAALSRLLDLPAPEPLYLGNDDLPVLESEVLAWLRRQEGLPPLPVAAGAEQGRRVANQRLRATGWAPVFPDYRAGYGPAGGPGV